MSRCHDSVEYDIELNKLDEWTRTGVRLDGWARR